MPRSIGLPLLGVGALCCSPALGQSLAWTLRGTGGPPELADHSMAYDSARHRVVLNGGCCANQTWERSGSNWTLASSGALPERDDGVIAYDAVRALTVLFGGDIDDQVFFGDTWLWNGTGWTQPSILGSTPSARAYFAMAYDAARQVTVLFGGAANDIANNETWEWNGTGWTQVWNGAPAPAARGGHMMSYDSARAVIVLFGGAQPPAANPVPLGDTWELDAHGWALRATTGPSPRYNGALAFNSDRGVSVLFGGFTGSDNDGQTWDWDGIAWTRRFISGPTPRSSHAMVYDPARGAVVLFGGEDNSGGPNSETWELMNCYANCDSSSTAPILNILDFTCFLNRFAAGDAYANCDHSTTPPVLNILDFTCFLNQFAAGCS